MVIHISHSQVVIRLYTGAFGGVLTVHVFLDPCLKPFQSSLFQLTEIDSSLAQLACEGIRYIDVFLNPNSNLY